MANDNKTSKKTARAFGIGLGISITLNLVLGGMVLSGGGSNGPEDTYQGEEATDTSFYEEQSITLQEQNDQLAQQVSDLEEQLASAESDNTGSSSDDSEEESSKESDEEESTDEHSGQRQAVLDASRGFLESFLTVDTSQDNYHQNRREGLSSYVTSDILDQIAPEFDQEDVAASGHEHEEGEGEPYYYKQQPESINIYVQESTLGSDSVNVIAQTHTAVEDNMDASYESHEQYDLTLEEQDGSWVVTDYSLKQTNEA